MRSSPNLYHTQVKCGGGNRAAVLGNLTDDVAYSSNVGATRLQRDHPTNVAYANRDHGAGERQPVPLLSVHLQYRGEESRGVGAGNKRSVAESNRSDRWSYKRE